MKFIVMVSLVSMAWASSPLHAQVLKCIDPKTKAVSYSDGSCPTGANGVEIIAKKSESQMLMERLQQQDAIRDKFERQQRARMESAITENRANSQESQARTAPFVANQSECERAIRNAETTASSLTAKKSRNELAERDANIKCYGSEQAGSIEKARAGAPKITIRNSSPSPSPAITHCAGAYCYDSLGGTHLMPPR